MRGGTASTLVRVALAGALLAGCSSNGAAGTPSPSPDDAAALESAAPESGAPQDASVSPDVDASAATGATGATTYFVSVINPSPGLCSFLDLATDDAGLVDCALLYNLAAGDTCEAHPGLMEAPAGLLAEMQTYEGKPNNQTFSLQGLCIAAQLQQGDRVNGSCAASTQAGWCYVTGSAAAPCAATFTVSPTGRPAGASPLLVCGVTPAGAVSPGSASSLGASCTPSPERAAPFGGFDLHEVTLDDGNPACPGAVCLVNHFRGLTTCPYGQEADGGGVEDASACTVPGTNTPVRPDSPLVQQQVSAQCSDRRPDQAVYCSCRCANELGKTDDGAPYCTCPSGYACTQVVPSAGSADPRAGAYCVRAGTAYDPSSSCTSTPCTPYLGNCP
jgi:hypothetical protein